MNYRNPFLVLYSILGFSAIAPGEIVISQYYEGTSFNKWVELANTSDAAMSLDGYVLTRWANASTEAWKQDGASPGGSDNLDGLSIPANGFLLFGNTRAVLPAYASADVSTNSTPNFNGDDSVVLYDTALGALGDTVAIVDAISFTDAGNEGANRSFYRIGEGAGFDLLAGSTAADFPQVWGGASNQEVDDAQPGDLFYLQSFSASAPESLSISLSPSVIGEDSGEGQVDVTVTRTGILLEELTVTLSSGDESEAVIATGTGVIPAGEDSITIPSSIDAVDDTIEDGDQEVVITASATGLSPAVATLTVADDNDVSPIAITEILADIPSGASGDANGDGDTDSADDEFVEIVNKSGGPLDMSGWSLRDRSEERHLFPAGTILPSDCAIVVFGGGSLDNLGGSAIFQTVSSIRLGLNNAGDTVSVYDSQGELVASVNYGSEGGNDQSLVRDPGISDGFTLHGSIGDGRLFSPGTRSDGSDYCPPLGELTFSLSASTMNENGGSISALLRRTGDLSVALDVVLAVSDETEALADLGARGTFAVDESSLTISLIAVDDIAEDGAQTVQVRAIAPGYTTAVASFEVEDDGDGPFSNLVINEFLSDPPNPGGDANRDGTLDTSQDEFIEFLNVSDEAFDLSDYEIHDGVGMRHVFSSGTLLAAGRAIVVFGGGSPVGAFGGSLVQIASSGLLGLNNSGDTIFLKTPGGGSTLLEFEYDGSVQDESMSRSPDGSGVLVAHSQASGAGAALFSPGVTVSGGSFDGAVAIEFIRITDFDIDRDNLEVIVEVDGLTPGDLYCFDVSLDLGNASSWFPFELLTTESGTEVSPGRHRFVVPDLFIADERAQYYRIRKP
ncbi:MAG: lamin tail domain-containing protein [Roseibacillus sp.]|nr:lamin tail domain-containing protein [Roseibacillus sp.]